MVTPSFKKNKKTKKNMVQQKQYANTIAIIFDSTLRQAHLNAFHDFGYFICIAILGLVCSTDQSTSSCVTPEHLFHSICYFTNCCPGASRVDGQRQQVSVAGFAALGNVIETALHLNTTFV
jgi:hypothetical protein